MKGRITPLFSQARVAASGGLSLAELLGDERRKTGWMRAEAAGDPGPWRRQALLGRGRWDADALRDLVRDYAMEMVPSLECKHWLLTSGLAGKSRGSQKPYLKQGCDQFN